MNDSLLGKRSSIITNDRAVCIDTVSVCPGVKYPVAIRVIGVEVVIALEIIHNKIIGCRKAPEFTFQRGGLGLVYLIDTPVVSIAQVERTGIIAGFSH